MLLKEQTSDPEALQKIIRTQNLRIQQLEEMLRQLRGERYGSSSEKMTDEQLRLFNPEENESLIEPIQKDEKVEGYTRKKSGRKKLPDHFETIRVEHDLKPEEKQCPCGCGEMVRIGEEISEQVHYVPAKFKRILNIRYKYACKKCQDNVYTAPLPLHILPKSNATPGFLAHIAVSKFQDGLPFYRQSQIYKRSGLNISRATLASWMIKIGELVQPLSNLILDHLISSSYIGMDETPFQVLKEENRKSESKSHMYVIRGGPPKQTATLFYYDPSRSRKVVKLIIDGFKGHLQTDAHRVYIGFDQMDEIVLLGCMAHARRYFHKAAKENKNKTCTAAEALEYFRKLYKVEKECNDLSDEDRYLRRQSESKPILQEFKNWMDDKIVKLVHRSNTGRALNYLNTNWKYLIRYVDHGHLRIDNNQVENAIRPFVVGRKNWLFCDTPAGALATANLYTLIETAKNNDWEPSEYLKKIFHLLPYCQKVEQYEFLLPWNFPREGEQRDKIPF